MRRVSNAQVVYKIHDTLKGPILLAKFQLLRAKHITQCPAQVCLHQIKSFPEDCTLSIWVFTRYIAGNKVDVYSTHRVMHQSFENRPYTMTKLCILLHQVPLQNQYFSYWIWYHFFVSKSPIPQLPTRTTKLGLICSFWALLHVAKNDQNNLMAIIPVPLLTTDNNSSKHIEQTYTQTSNA